MAQTRPGKADRDVAQLVACLRATLPDLLAETEVVLAYLHGSTVTGLTHPFSDVDIALVVGDGVSPARQLDLMLGLNVDLADHCDIRNADVRIINDAPLMLKGSVVTEGILVYERDEASRVDFEVSTRLRYFDYLPVHREMQETFLGELRKRGLYG